MGAPEIELSVLLSFCTSAVDRSLWTVAACVENHGLWRNPMKSMPYTINYENLGKLFTNSESVYHIKGGNTYSKLLKIK